MSKKQIIIAHGTTGKPERNWFPWLTYKLIERGHDVFVPRLPTPEDQNLSNWKKTFKDQTPTLNKDTILIGHSTGPLLLFSELEESKVAVAGLVVVSGFCSALNIPDFDPLLKTFIEHQYDWNKIKENAKVRISFHGTEDPYVPLELGREVAQKIDAEWVVIDGGKHLNTEAKFFSFEKLFTDLCKKMNC